MPLDSDRGGGADDAEGRLGDAVFFEERGESCEGAVGVFAVGGFGFAEGVADLEVGEALVEAEDDDVAVGRGEFVEGGVDEGCESGPGLGVGGGFGLLLLSEVVGGLVHFLDPV